MGCVVRGAPPLAPPPPGPWFNDNRLILLYQFLPNKI